MTYLRALAMMLALVAIIGLSLAVGTPAMSLNMTIRERVRLRDEVFDAFRHAYGAYIKYAYPSDELMPLSCQGRPWDRRARGTIDDALGGYALTMVDSLDMHAVVGDAEAFRRAVQTLLGDFESGVLTFDRDVTVSVFEASIRVVGGLGDWYRESNPLEKTLECVLRPCALPCHHAQLSAHQIATYLEAGGRLGSPGWYDGGLLTLAYDLGKRLLPAFDTPLGIPIHRVNLRKGVSRGETRDTCAAAAGTFLVEFGALSRLTGDQSFEAAARRAVEALWKRRSPLGLVGGGVGGTTGRWASRPAGIGAGTDSFYEYLQKSAKLFGDEGMGEMFREAYAGVEEHLLWGGWHVEKDMYRGNKALPHNYRVSALQAFWPAVQVAAGDVERAESTYDSLFGLWKKYGALPDFYDVQSESLLHYGRDSPLRPELAESTLALYGATGSTQYLRAGADLLRELRRSRVECGYASIGDVRTGSLDDRMDSYFIAETLKYLFLLFDSSLPSEEQQSLFCTLEEESETDGDAGRTVKMNPAAASAVAEAVGSTAFDGARNASAMWNANSSVSPSSSRDRGESGGLGYDVLGSNQSARTDSEQQRGSRDSRENSRPAPPPPPRCLRWSDTVLSTEGHPFIASALAVALEHLETPDEVGASTGDGREAKGREGSHERSESAPGGEWYMSVFRRAMAMLRGRLQKETGSSFEPWHHYARAVNSAGFKRRPKDAELEIKCETKRGECDFHDAGPRFLTHLKQAAGEDWSAALATVCDWVRDSVFSLDMTSNALAEGQSFTYRLHQITPVVMDEAA